MRKRKLTALGRDVHEDPTHEPLIGREDLLALDKVFRGEGRSIAELAEVLRRASP
jgi:hypothetical protein